jgi:hypothetical protein
MATRHASLVPLSHDHRDALALAFRLHHPAPPGPVTPVTPASTPESRARETVAFHDANLVHHFAAEETALFPALRGHLPAPAPERALLDGLEAEHRHLTALRDRIAATAGADALGPLLAEFADVLERHVRTEERQLFARLPDLLPADVAARLGPAIRAALAVRSDPACPA